MKTSILIVDDSPSVHQLVRTHLQGEPVEIHSAYCGEDALSTAARLQPSLILLDVDMPKMDGFEVCRRLKANPKTEFSPILFLTVDSSLDDKIKGLDLGAADYMAKSFKPEELCARVRAALRAKERLDSMSMVDPLTGLWNETYLELHLTPLLSLARRTHRPLTCVMVEMDHVDKIDEKHGKSAGEDVLRGMAKILTGLAREEDAVCYAGSGKFILLAPGMNRGGGVQFVDRVKAEIEEQLKTRNGIEIDVTCSFGVADTEAEIDESLLDRADAALYRARHQGYNHVSISRPAAETRAVG